MTLDEVLAKHGIVRYKELFKAVAKDYATECCKATLEKAKDRTLVRRVNVNGSVFSANQIGTECGHFEIDKESITLPENIVLL